MSQSMRKINIPHTSLITEKKQSRKGVLSIDSAENGPIKRRKSNRRFHRSQHSLGTSFQAGIADLRTAVLESLFT